MRRLAAALLAAVLAHGLWTFGVHAVSPLLSPWSRDYGEGSVLAMAQILAEGRSYFVDLRDYPFILGNYPPFFIGLTALAERAFGPSLWAPRLLALLATLGTLGVLYAMMRRSLARWPALAFTALFVMPWFVTTWASLARVDMPAIFFSISALALVARHGASPRAWPALPLSWLAFFSKHNALYAPAAVFADLLLARERRWPKLFLLWLLPLAALFGALVLATGGAAWTHLVTWTAAAEYEWPRMWESYLQLAVVSAPLLALIAAAAALAPQALFSGPNRLLALYFAFNLLGFATIAKAGAAQCYFIEPWLATVLLSAAALSALRERFPLLRAWWPAVLLAAAATADYAYPSLDRIPAAIRRPQNSEEFVELTRLVRKTPGPILSENLPLLIVNRRPFLFDPWGIVMLQRKGLFCPAVLVRDCFAGRFPLVIVEYRMLELPGFGECLERRYEPIADLGPYQALRPRGRPRLAP